MKELTRFRRSELLASPVRESTYSLHIVPLYLLQSLYSTLAGLQFHQRIPPERKAKEEEKEAEAIPKTHPQREEMSLSPVLPMVMQFSLPEQRP